MPADEFPIRALARIDFSRHGLRGILEKVTQLAQRTLAADGEASVTLIRQGRAYTAACTGEPARRLDEIQYESGVGPCLDAVEALGELTIEDMAAETRWPAFCVAAAERGIQSSLSLRLPVQTTVTGSLNVYSPRQGAFDADAVAVGRSFADYVAVAVANSRLYAVVATQARQMRDGMERRAVIDHAVGIIMADWRCPPDEAFDMLRLLSGAANKNLREVAADVVARTQQGECPPYS